MFSSETPEVSVVMPFYNCPYVNQAIESVLSQTYPNVELIVVNDGSNQHMDLISPYLHRIRYIEKENGGTASALNTGIRYAKGVLFSWLSSDDLFDHRKIEKQISFLLRTDADLIYSNFNTIDSNNNLIGTNVGIHVDNQIDIVRLLTVSNPVNGSTVMIKMDVLQDVGLFDESLRYTHDYDLWIRVALNYVVLSQNTTLLNYRIHDAMGSKKHFHEQLQEFQMVRSKYQEPLNHWIRAKNNKRIT